MIQAMNLIRLLILFCYIVLVSVFYPELDLLFTVFLLWLSKKLTR